MQKCCDTRNRPVYVCRILSVLAALSLSWGSVIAADYPVPLVSKADIGKANSEITEISIQDLPVSDFPLLLKFPQLRSVLMWSRDETNVGDIKLIALTQLKLTNLSNIGLLNAKSVTYKGIQSLTNFSSLRSLGLEGTSISDSGCETIAHQMRLTTVNVANCSSVTAQGLRALAISGTLTEITFSAEELGSIDAATIIDALNKNIKWCQIVDPQRKINVRSLKARGAAKGVHIVVKPTGALQDMGFKPVTN